MEAKTKKAITGCGNVKKNLKTHKMLKVAFGESGIVFKLNNLKNKYAVKFSIADSYYNNNIVVKKIATSVSNDDINSNICIII